MALHTGTMGHVKSTASCWGFHGKALTITDIWRPCHSPWGLVSIPDYQSLMTVPYGCCRRILTLSCCCDHALINPLWLRIIDVTCRMSTSQHAYTYGKNIIITLKPGSLVTVTRLLRCSVVTYMSSIKSNEIHGRNKTYFSANLSDMRHLW